MLIEGLFALAAMLLTGLAALLVLRLRDARADRALETDLRSPSGRERPRFDLSMLEGLPAPAARYLRFAIRPGTELRTIALVEMGGTLLLGTAESTTERPMLAKQILAPPRGFLWEVRLQGMGGVTGSDAYAPGGSWSRFRFLDLVPVGRVSQDADHLRSAFGRMVGEALIWTPAAFLAAAEAGWNEIRWHAVDPDTAAVTVRLGDLAQSAEVTVDGTGRPLRVLFQRWSKENADGIYRLQPFGGDLSEFREFEGFTLPLRVTGGNHYGTDLYHPFYKAEVKQIRLQ